ncbi:chaperonin GroS protein [Besnoitia besnoiti]|uniref:Chaperonin GroS protein n=1 Tax=Besnoitia besnoiti TaxID=94643 RepID=A0A2A9MIR4_BESBE|nr:chaperonin GroS protein [Besnoitia besnoiti]PFH38428.1 chaperonin GroS protein [Besnoitia besnoiti]
MARALCEAEGPSARLRCAYTESLSQRSRRPSRRLSILGLTLLPLASMSVLAPAASDTSSSALVFAVANLNRPPASAPQCSGYNASAGSCRSSDPSLAFVRGQPPRALSVPSPSASAALSPAVQDSNALSVGPASVGARSSVGLLPLKSAKFSFEGDEIGGPIKPLRGMVLLERREAVEKSSGGVYLPSESKGKQVVARVLEVGSGEVNRDTGVRIPIDVVPGDWAIISRHALDSFKYNGKDCVLVEARDILAKVRTTVEERDANPSDLLPLGDTVLVRLTKLPERTASGLYLHQPGGDRSRSQSVKRAEVISVGPGCYNKNGERVPVDVKAGDHVLFSPYSQDEPEMTYGSNSYAFLKAADLLARW